MSYVEPVEILLAEDSPTDAELTLGVLQTQGLINNIVWVKDGAEALDYLFREGAYATRAETLPKLVLLDIKMPKLDGIDVLRKIRSDERLKTIPVVMLTSSSEESDIVQSYSLGLNSYIVKPVEFDKFVKEVSQLGLYWTVMNKVPRLQ